MANTVRQKQARSQVYYSTSYAIGSGTTSTLALVIWRALSHHLQEYQKPMTAEQLAVETGLSSEQIDALFGQTYYQRHYGYRRFNSLEEWQTWAMETGVLYNPAIHDLPEEEPIEAEDDEEEEEAAL
jgi:hypothetical protein